MTEQKLKRANYLFYGIERINDIEKDLWNLFEGAHENEFREINKALFIVKAKLLKEFNELKCD